MDRAAATGFGISLVGHAALFAILSLALVNVTRAPPPPAAMEVSFVDAVALTSASPAPSAEPAAAARAPELGPVEDAASTPTPPQRILELREPAPAPAPGALPTPRPAASASAGSGQATRRPGLGDLDPRSFGHDETSRSNTPPAAVMSAQAQADIGQAIARQVQPCADRQTIPYGAGGIVTQINLRLNRDGSLAARPRVVRQLHADGDNARYAQRAADIAIAAFSQCSPLRGLPQELYDVPRGWSNFTLNYRLPG
jgi:hypothetical protein